VQGEGREYVSSKTAPPLPTSPPPIDDELRLIGDLTTAQVGQPKRFSIDTNQPNNVDVIVTGRFSIKLILDLTLE
jgi:hypothetical protein